LHGVTGPGGLRMLRSATADRIRPGRKRQPANVLQCRLAAHLPARGVFLRCLRTAPVTDWPCGQSASVVQVGEEARLELVPAQEHAVLLRGRAAGNTPGRPHPGPVQAMGTDRLPVRSRTDLEQGGMRRA
jgi:hypothetical protein